MRAALALRCTALIRVRFHLVYVEPRVLEFWPVPACHCWEWGSGWWILLVADH